MYYMGKSEREQKRESAKYFVLYKLDNKSTKQQSYGGVQLYDCMNYVDSKKAAKNFAMNNMPAIIGKRKLKNKSGEDLDFIVAGEFNGKYKSWSYGDSSPDWLTTYDAVTCKKNEIGSVINHYSSEQYFKRVEVGVKVKLF